MYRAPILAWLVRRGQDLAKAEDLTQGFMVHLLEKNRLQGFVRGEAKFRSFLLRCLQRFMRDQWRKEATTVLEPLEDHEPPVEAVQDRAFDRDLALAIHRRVMAALRESHAEPGRIERFEVLQRYILGSDREAPYAGVAQQLHMTVGAARKAVFDLREEYCDVFRAEVAETVARGAVDEEMRYLIPLLTDTEAAAPA
jgi:RNA polymerase sigma-70 factor (ECF subfamily)